jgi:hypothetical protein
LANSIASRKEGRNFFFEKKKQKTFIFLSAAPWQRAWLAARFVASRGYATDAGIA